MPQALIISNTKWFTLNFKDWLVVELLKNYKVTVLYLNEGPTSSSIDLNSKKYKNLKFSKLSISSFLNCVNSSWNSSIVFAFTAEGIILSPFIAPFSKKRIATIEGLGRIFSSRDITTRLLKRIILIVYKILFKYYFSRVFVINYSDYNYILENNLTKLEKLCYVPGTGVDTNLFSKENFKSYSDNRDDCERFSVGMITRLANGKGVNTFIASRLAMQNQFTELSKRVDYIIIAPEKQLNLLPESYKKSLSKLNIFLKPYNKNVIVMYKLLDIIVHPSTYFEGLSRVMLEAGALEIPIITCPNRGISDLIPDDQYAYLINTPPSPLQIAIAISNVIQNPERSIKRSSKLRKRVTKYFSLEKASKSFLQQI